MNEDKKDDGPITGKQTGAMNTKQNGKTRNALKIERLIREKYFPAIAALYAILKIEAGLNVE